ncbi:hypothetical protein RJ639_010982 [Escallonia herrerae]|uniref:Uncharacterized protein n=1 Tax=Escallonia herrerae TaxID=1293975 RepID=A0AA89AMR7_9ASTE|nr:hypothetical protein RJ639_010982 [Escallonia herrerae]
MADGDCLRQDQESLEPGTKNDCNGTTAVALGRQKNSEQGESVFDKIMFGFSIRTRENVTGSPRATGSPGSVASPRTIGTPRVTDSPKPETVGEIDTRAPFRSVKAAVSLFGEGASPKARPQVKKPKTAEERVLEKETQLHLNLKEVDKFREQLKNAETTKAQALRELEKANRTLQELTSKLENVSESKQAAIAVTEALKNRAKQLEESKASQPQPSDGILKQDVDREREQYRASAGELNSAKQELANLRQDFDAALEAKLAAFQQAADAQHTAEVNREKLSELSKEMTAMRGTLDQVKLASARAQDEHLKLMAENEAIHESHRTAKEDMEKKMQSLKEESNQLVLEGNIDEKLEETTEAIGLLQGQLKNVHESDLNALRDAVSELDYAKKTLREVLDEESLLRSMVESLQLEMENAKRDNLKLEEKESKTESLNKKLQVELDVSKAELQAAMAGELEAKDASDDMHLKLQESLLQAKNARQEAEDMDRITRTLKQEAETSRTAAKEAEAKLQIALKEAEEAKAAEKLANDQMHDSDNSDATNSGSSDGKIKLSTKDFESLTKKAKEVGNSADMKVATAMAQVEAIIASEKDALRWLESSLKETEDMEAATKDALKKADMAEAAKQAVEGELQKWRQKEQNDVGETSSQEETEM